MNFPMILLPFKWMLSCDYLQDSHLGVPLPLPMSDKEGMRRWCTALSRSSRQLSGVWVMASVYWAWN